MHFKPPPPYQLPVYLTERQREAQAKWNVPRQPRADVSKFGYVRWPRWLAEADMPAEWTATDLKLWIFAAHKMNLQNPWSYHRIHWKEARAFLGGGCSKNDIRASLQRLADHSLTITQLPDLFGYGYREKPTFPVLRASYQGDTTGVWDQEMCWIMEPLMISELANYEDGYGRAQLSVIRKLESFGAIRLYLWAKMLQHSLKDPLTKTWSLAEVAAFMGCKPTTRVDNLKSRVIEPVLAELNAAGLEITVDYHRDPGTHGKATTALYFRFPAYGGTTTKWT